MAKGPDNTKEVICRIRARDPFRKKRGEINLHHTGQPSNLVNEVDFEKMREQRGDVLPAAGDFTERVFSGHRVLPFRPKLER